MTHPADRPRFHLAVPVDDLNAARVFYGELLGCRQGRSSDSWVDWDLRGHQFVTHLAPDRPRAVHNLVDGHDVPIPHFGLILTFLTSTGSLIACGPPGQRSWWSHTSASRGSRVNSGRCSCTTRRATRWSSRLSPTTRRCSPDSPLADRSIEVLRSEPAQFPCRLLSTNRQVAGNNAAASATLTASPSRKGVKPSATASVSDTCSDAASHGTPTA